MIKQLRAAGSLLNPDEVRRRAERPLTVGLVATDGSGYAELEEFLLPASLPREVRLPMMERVFRAGDRNVPERVDLVLYQQGIPHNDGAYTFHRQDPESVIAQIVHDHEDYALPLARQFPVFRKPIADGMIQSVARENAFFAIATALPNIVPNLIELPWAFGEFASDTAFLTANQVRMAFLIATAYGKDPSFTHQKMEILSIAASAFGWRALARELVGHIPLGGGLIPKGAIAYAGTFAVGKSLEYFHRTNQVYSSDQRNEEYRRALESGKEVAESLTTKRA
jgi:uncharacterized protein (DUF697 family)